jgi:hypothetical protein
VRGWNFINYVAPHCATSSILVLLHSSLVQIFSLEACSQTPSVYALPLIWEIKFHTHTKQLAKLWFCIYFKLCIPRQQERRQKTLDRMVASIPQNLSYTI